MSDDPGTKLTIRRYRAEDDEEAAVDVWSRASKAAHSFLDEEGWAERERRLREVYLVQADNWVAETPDGVVGLLGLVGAEIGGLFVAPEAQGLGVGRALVEHAARLHGAVRLEVYERNTRARRIYEHLGFRRESSRVDEETGHVLLAMYRANPREAAPDTTA